MRRLFEVLAGPVADCGQAGSFYRGLRTVVLDGTHLRVPDDEQVTWRYPKRVGGLLEFGYPLLRLLVVAECGTRAVLAACFDPEDEGELPYARRLLSCLDASMLLGDAAFDAVEFLREVTATGARFLVRSSARRQRVKAHSRKNPTSKYGPNAGKHPQTAQTYRPDLHPFCRDPRHGRRTCITPSPVNATVLTSTRVFDHLPAATSKSCPRPTADARRHHWCHSAYSSSELNDLPD
ncbi:transposase [Kitasatospora sp. NPDC058162]|uniref:transposase n=1 Tax=Kitasatospora sp. NPDC058162 TaxID=3346362 RepID=UPI0036D8698F